MNVEDTQRRNLASIGRILQAAASGQSGEGSHPKVKEFVSTSWPLFRKYFLDATDVESPEEHFSMDEYTDVVLLTKPQITISPEDIYYLHDVSPVTELFLQRGLKTDRMLHRCC